MINSSNKISTDIKTLVKNKISLESGEIQKIPFNNDNIYHYIPNQISGMTDIKLIDTGGFGAVFKSFHILDENYYALKCIPLDKNNNKIREKTLEIKLLSRLSHPNIIRYYNSWLEYIPNKKPKFISNSIEKMDEITENPEFFLFIQMEYCTINLKNFLKNIENKDKIPYIIKGIFSGLEYLHSQEIVHCDLKMDNILIKEEPINIKITDFGISNLKGIKTTNYKYYGSDLYRPPEMNLENYIPDYTTDIYSLGILFYEIITPFKTEMERVLSIGKFKEGLSKTLTILDKMVNKNPKLRPNLSEIKIYVDKLK